MISPLTRPDFTLPETSGASAPAPVAARAGLAGEADPERELLARELGTQYQVVRPLGRGAMGAVFLCRDLALHRMVAVKVLRVDHADSEDARERFRREARLLARMTHPNIVPVHAFGETPAITYMVMKYVAGESLAERLWSEKRMSTSDARRVLAELADALEYAHRQGVVHRDLKPENILLDRESGSAMLADFGVATMTSWHPSPDELRHAFGTPHFMAPEQALGQTDVDGRADLYALGVLGYLMLSGRLPFEGAAPSELVARQLTDAPDPLARLAPRAPTDLVAVVERCLEPTPDDRFRAAREMHEALTTRRGRAAMAWPWVAGIVAVVGMLMR
ncbi:MAG: serine/threonine-protein kinase [Gemmatimonadaceae bacterium]